MNKKTSNAVEFNTDLRSTQENATNDSENARAPELNAEQVAEFLRANPEFFLKQDELLADISLPHESGKAISLLERQVNILRGRGNEARQKLGLLLNNARNNDQLFDTTRILILALLRCDTADAVANIVQDQLSDLENIDYCEIILIGDEQSTSVRNESAQSLTERFKDVFRLKRTHCGALPAANIAYLFGDETHAKSTALCPIIENDEVLALLALGNQHEDYFNLNLDTLFLDFIGEVIGAILKQKLAST